MRVVFLRASTPPIERNTGPEPRPRRALSSASDPSAWGVYRQASTPLPPISASRPKRSMRVSRHSALTTMHASAARIDRVCGVTRRGSDWKGNGVAMGLAEEATAPGVGRVQHGLHAEVFERLAEVHRMHDAATRKRRMRQHGDANRAAHAACAPAPNPI